MKGRWQTYHPTSAEPWDIGRAVHLYRAAGFGTTHEQLQRDLHDGPDAAIGRLVSGKCSSRGQPPNFEYLSGIVCQRAVQSNDIERLKAWWIYRMLFTSDPLGERLALMWHNHFATSNAKVEDVGMMHRQNERLRQFARAPFGELLHSMVHDPALLKWLDAPENRKQRYNENLGRELMELFTLGADHFSESDVKESARALTGLNVLDGEVRYVADWHDNDDETILGKTLNFDAETLCDHLADQPATSCRIAWRIGNTFLGQDIATDAEIAELAGPLREHDLNVGWAVETVLRSQLFHSNQNVGAQVVSPPVYLVSAARALEVLDPPPSTLAMADWSRRAGQDLFYPPNVGGWAGGNSWLSTRGVISRANFVLALVRGELNHERTKPKLEAIAGRAGRDSSAAEALALFNDLLLGGRLSRGGLKQIGESAPGSLMDSVALLLATPEAQLA